MLRRVSAAVGIAVAFLAPAVTAIQSSLYPTVDSVSLANAFNVSLGCLEALNETVSCDGNLLRMAADVDNYMWYQDNATALCTDDCLSTTRAWWSDVIASCSNDYINVRGRQVPPLTIPGRMLDGMNLVCLTPDTDVTTLPGIVGTELTTTLVSVVNSTVPDDPTVPNGTDTSDLTRRSSQLVERPSSEVNEIQVAGNITQRQTATSSGYCLIDSYSWVGQDIIRPDCTDDSSEPQCLDPTDVPDENQRIANLYPDSMLCTDCFLKIFYLRMASPYLPDLDASDYHLEQYLDIVDVCQATMPELVVRELPQYLNVDGVDDGALDTNNTLPSATVACGQTLTMTDLQNLVVPDPNANGTIFCDALSTTYNVTSGDVQVAFDDFFCQPATNFTSVCLPAPCTLVEIPANTTCDLVISQAEGSITATQLLNWNPNLMGFCDQLYPQYVCISAPGGSYIPPPVSNATSSDSGQVRGGGTGSSTGSGSAIGGGRNATVVPIGGQAPSPTQSGITPLCTEYVMASAGDGCYSLTQLWDIPEEDFFAWNTILGPDGENCTTELWADTYYCIDIVRSATTTSIPTTTASATSVTPAGPTQTGIISTCNKFVESISGLGCADFAAAEGITTAELYLWNPVLGANGENCGTNLWADEWYCVGVSTTSATTTTTTTASTTTSGPTTTGVTPPGPTQTGIISTCNKYAESISGLGCYDFAVAEGITPELLYEWNSVLGPNGENCGTQLWADEYYCVGVAPPGPTQPGIISTCNKYAESIPGLGCYDFAVAEGITPDELYAWNTVLGANGENCGTDLWADEYYCVGVSTL